MQAEPTKHHAWLQQIVGAWTYEADCSMGPDQQTAHVRGTETVRSLGGLWVVCEGEGDMPGGGRGTSLMTLGYDPRTARYIGTWVGSMMTALWVYNGTLDAAERALTLEVDGPGFNDPNRIVKYRDVIELTGDDTRTMTSNLLGDDGNWTTFMTARYRRA